MHIVQLLNEHLTREGASRKSEWVSLSEDALKSLKVLKQACTTAPVLTFADYTKPFLLETDASKDGLRAVLSQKQVDEQYHLITYGSRALTPHEKNYHLTKLEFLVLKWAVTEHFKEYLPYQAFLVKTDNNPLTYIMMTPNLNATGHWWVGALAQFNFKPEYQKGHDNTVADVLSWITTWLEPDTVKSILDGVALGAAHWDEVHDPAIVEGNLSLDKEVHVTAGHVLVQMHVTGLGWSSKGRPNVECISILAEGPEEDWFKGTSGRTCFQWGRPNDPTESTELLDSSRSLISVLNAQGRGWRSATICSP